MAVLKPNEKRLQKTLFKNLQLITQKLFLTYLKITLHSKIMFNLIMKIKL